MAFSDVIKNSIQSGENPASLRDRQESVREILPIQKRIALQAIDGVILLMPRLRFAAQRAGLRAKGIHYIGAGVESTVVKSGDMVIKYVRGTEKLSAGERGAFRDRKQLDFEKVQTHMSDFVLSQSIVVGPHIATPKHEYVQTIQPFTHFDPLLQRRSVDSVDIARDIDADTVAQMRHFLEASWLMYDDCQLLPDINGRNNLVRTQETGVILLDTQPIGSSQVEIQDIIKRQLDDLDAELSLVYE